MRFFFPLRGAGALETASTVEQLMTSTETPWRDESLLQELYWEQHLSTNEIANEWDCDQATDIRPSSEELAYSNRERDDRGRFK